MQDEPPAVCHKKQSGTVMEKVPIQEIAGKEYPSILTSTAFLIHFQLCSVAR